MTTCGEGAHDRARLEPHPHSAILESVAELPAWLASVGALQEHLGDATPVLGSQAGNSPALHWIVSMRLWSSMARSTVISGVPPERMARTKSRYMAR